ncbi:MAG: cupin domain-containing protein [Paracoccaceae bacterium]
MAGFVLSAGTTRGRTFHVFGQTVTERITAEDSGGAYYVMEELSPPGTGVPPHRHTHEDEIVQVLEGTFEVFLDGVVSVVTAGATLHFARGTHHGFRNIGSTDGRTLWFATPGTATQAFLRELSTFPEGPPDIARLNALHAAYGITM